MIFLKCAALAFLIPLWIAMTFAAISAIKVCVGDKDEDAGLAAIVAVIIMIIAGGIAGCIFEGMI